MIMMAVGETEVDCGSSPRHWKKSLDKLCLLYPTSYKGDGRNREVCSLRMQAVNRVSESER